MPAREERTIMNFNYSDLFLVAALFFMACHVVVIILIMHELDKRGVRTNFLLVRLLVFRYVHQYKEITAKEMGKPGPLFYLYIVSVNLALVAGIIGLILRRI
jgi:hypothetical protein